MTTPAPIDSREAVARSGFADRMPDVTLPKAPPTGVRKLGIWMLVLGVGLFGGLGSWAAIAPMKSAIVASGAFRVVGDRLAVQHYEGGIVRQIAVQEGDLVREGEVIARLDETRTNAQISIITSQLANALAREARLAAEQREAENVEVSEELAALIEEDPDLEEMLHAQRDVFESNRDMIDGQVAILRGRIDQLEEQLAGHDARRQSLEDQLALVRDEIEGLAPLFEQGLVTKARIVGRQQDEAAILGDLGSVNSDRNNTLQQVTEMQERILQIRRNRLLEINDERQDVQAEIFDLRQRLEATREVKERLVIRAPRTGRVVNLAINTIGGVVDPSQRILEIVPTDADFVVETKVKPGDIDDVSLGGKARVRLTAYSFRSTPPVAGEVVHVSPDSLIDRVTGEPYFQVDVKLSPEALSELPHIQTLPGMPAEVMIETGEQTLADYILNPVVGGMEKALIEKE